MKAHLGYEIFGFFTCEMKPEYFWLIFQIIGVFLRFVRFIKYHISGRDFYGLILEGKPCIS